MTEDQMTSDLLHRLASGVETPLLDPLADLRRGRRRLATRRAADTGTSAAVAALVVGALAFGPGVAGPRSAGVAAHPSAADPAADPSASARVSHSSSRWSSAHQGSDDPSPDGFEQAGEHAQTTFDDVLAEHLDPGRLHLQAVSPDTANEQTAVSAGAVVGYGSRLEWQIADADPAMLQVYVTREWQDATAFAPIGEGWQLHDVSFPGVQRARVATGGGVVQVQVQHDDGQVVELRADPRRGPDPLGLTAEQLLAAAADPRLSLAAWTVEDPPTP